MTGHEAYRGYLIMVNLLNGKTWIEKQGHLISWARSINDAKEKIDELLD